MPRSPEQNQVIREKRIQQILEAALTVFSEKGYHGTEIGVIAKRAGMGRSLIYYYFKDKQDVFIQLIHRTLRLWREEMNIILESGCSVTDRMGRILKKTCAFCQDHPDLSRFHQMIARDLQLLFSGREEEVRRYFEENIRQPVRALMEEGVQTGEIRVAPELAERFFFSILFGAIHHECILEKSQLNDWVKLSLYGLTGEKSVSVSWADGRRISHDE